MQQVKSLSDVLPTRVTANQLPRDFELSELLVAEFTDGPSVVTYGGKEGHSLIHTDKARGLRLGRLISIVPFQGHEVVTEFDSEKDYTPLDFFFDKDVVFVATVKHRPDEDAVGWAILALRHGNSLRDQRAVLDVLGVVDANEEQAAYLNTHCPGWLEWHLSVQRLVKSELN